MPPLVVPILLLLLGLGLIVLELFVPSGGVLSLLSIAAVVAAIVLAFARYGPVWGTVMLGIATFAVPVVIFAMIKYWPNTSFGRLILIKPNEDLVDVLPDKESDPLRLLVGKTGRARSKMLPSGAVVIDGRTYDAISRGVAIDPGQPIRVIEVEGNHLVVAPAPEEETVASGEAGEEDPLARPIDAAISDPFEDA